MPKVAYRNVVFRPAAQAIIAQADAICADYAAQGYSLTLRQLYYQFVARDLIPNRQTEYKRLGSIINDARLAGLIDWSHIVDRTREMHQLSHWGDPNQEGADSARDFVESVMPQFRTMKWQLQPVRVEVWIEKDALRDVVARPAGDPQDPDGALDIPYFACRGYNSQSNAWAAAQRIRSYYAHGARKVVILHLGDHDPSGIDMTRDIRDRLSLFLDRHGIDARRRLEVRRIALNMSQVRAFNPPPNPAKITDSRAGRYIERFGPESWELDALDPPTIDALVRDHVLSMRDHDAWRIATKREREGKQLLQLATDNWGELASYIEEQYGDDHEIDLSDIDVEEERGENAEIEIDDPTLEDDFEGFGGDGDDD